MNAGRFEWGYESFRRLVGWLRLWWSWLHRNLRRGKFDDFVSVLLQRFFFVHQRESQCLAKLSRVLVTGIRIKSQRLENYSFGFFGQARPEVRRLGAHTFARPLRILAPATAAGRAALARIPSLLGRDILGRFALFLEERTDRVLLLTPEEADQLNLPR